jgi:hypothetical protein
MKGKLVSSFSLTRNYPWPNILKDLKVAIDEGNSATAIRDWVPGDNIPSVVTIKTYVSDIAPSRYFLQTDTPKPTEIDGAYLYQRISYPPCLHGEVILENRYQPNSRFYDAMPSKRGARLNLNHIVHSPTNHITWKSHIFDVDVAEDDGLFFRTVSLVEAPKLPKTILV